MDKTKYKVIRMWYSTFQRLIKDFPPYKDEINKIFGEFK